MRLAAVGWSPERIALAASVPGDIVTAVLRGRKREWHYVRCPGCGGLVLPPCRFCEPQSIPEE